MTTAERIARRLRQALAPVHLEILDESAKHAGHAGAAAGGGHFSCTIVSEAFRGRSRLERHRAVYRALGDLLKREVHALALETLDPTQWAAKEGPGPEKGRL
ncbi:MAG TPA: BolA family transcriptional regulator [Candidatus Binatia bacterium]|nr:BolA family transcriptional regulator [Candidatus Binatia bacterium]